MRLALGIEAAYLTVTLASLLTGAVAVTGPALALHLVAAALAWGGAAMIVSPSPARGGGWIRIMRDWLPLLLIPVIYRDLGVVIDAVGRPHADVLIQAWERSWFGEPWRTLAPRAPWLFVSEVLHAAYLAFYAIVAVPPLLLYRRGRREAFAITVLATVIIYVVSALSFIVFPIDGPRYLSGPAAAPDGPVRALTLWLLETGSSRGTAFPSLHVSASIVAAACALRFQPRVGAIVCVATAALMVATVYGGFHYAVDVVAGSAVGIVVAALVGGMREPSVASERPV